MSGSNRGLFLAGLAGVAALITAWGSGYYTAALNYPEEQRHQPYRYAADKPAEIDPALSGPIDTKTQEYRSPCDNPNGRDESDLCAQWRAASAAEDSALWAKWGFWVGLGGMLGLFVTLGFNYAAWDQARRAEADTVRALEAAERNADAAMRLAETAESNSKKELRAYVDFLSARYERWPSYDNGPEIIGIKLKISFRNYGKTPAENVHAVVQKTLRGPLNEGFGLMEEESKAAMTSIAPSDDFHLQYFFRVTAKTFELIDLQKMYCGARVLMTYTDVFGAKRILRGGMECRELGEEMSIIEGTREST